MSARLKQRIAAETDPARRAELEQDLAETLRYYEQRAERDAELRAIAATEDNFDRAYNELRAKGWAD